MINVSDEFYKAMQDRTDFVESAEITLANGTVLSVTKDDFTISNNSIVDGAGESSFPLGVAIARSIQIELMNDEGQFSLYDFFGAEIRLYLSFELSASTEKIAYGKFTVSTPETRGTTVIITAVDDMHKADAAYNTNLLFPATTGDLLRDSCATTGISLATANFTNSDFLVQEKPEGITHRQLIGYIAMIAGGNARINRSGYLEIITYNFDDIELIIDGGTFQPWTTGESVSGGTFNPWTAGEAISGGDFTKPETYHVLHQWINAPIIDTDDIVITGVQTTYNDGENDVDLLEGEEGYVIKIDNPLIIGKEQTAISLIGERIIGGTFRQFEGDHIGYPIAEFMDPAVIVDRLGNAYATFITDIDFVFLGVTTLKNSSEPVLRNNSQYYSGSTETLRKARSLVKKEQTAREQAIKNLEEALSIGSGLFMTQEKQSDGSYIYYMHNKSKLSDSDIVWKLTADAIGISTDGGKTYPYGLIVTGEAILNKIYAEGINADYIDTGAIAVKDANGNIVFSVDMDTKSVVISGDSVRIGDKTATKAISDVEELAEKAISFYLLLDNESQGIATDYNGDYTTFPTTKTTVTAFYGHTDVSDSCSYSVSKSSGVTGSWNASTKTYTVTALTADSGWVDITATYLSVFTVTKRFTINKIKGGVPGRTYFIESSTADIKVGAFYNDTFKNRELYPESFTVAGYYRVGNDSTKYPYAGDWKVENMHESGLWADALETYYTISENVLTFDMTKYENSYDIWRYRMLKFTLYEAGTTNIIDTQTIPFLWDVDSLTHDEIFNLLTNDGTVKGIYKEGDQLYISFTYAKGGTLVLGGTGNADGVLEVQDSSGNKMGGIDNTGMEFSSTDSDGAVRTAKVRNGGVYFYKDGVETGLIRRIAWGNDYDNSEGIMFGTLSKYLALAYNLGSGYAAGYILNAGLNPGGYTERNLFYGTTRFIDDVKFPGKINSITISATNVAVTNKSADGAYYGTAINLAEQLLDSKTIVGVLVVDWTHAAASFTPYYQSGEIKIMSDVSMTIGTLKLRLTYI